MQTDHLYWLGRYLERVKVTLDVSGDLQDLVLDNVEGYDLESLCRRLAIPNIYAGPDDFLHRFIFEAENPDSVVSNMNRAFDNAIVLRSVLHTSALSYIQLALDALQRGAKSASPMLEVQETLDYVYAFWGITSDTMTDMTATRNVMLVGKSVERIDLNMRLGVRGSRAAAEAERLGLRLQRSGMSYDEERFRRIITRLDDGSWTECVAEVVEDVDNLIHIL